MEYFTEQEDYFLNILMNMAEKEEVKNEILSCNNIDEVINYIKALDNKEINTKLSMYTVKMLNIIMAGVLCRIREKLN